MQWQALKFEGIVIGYQDQGDADRLISFYTPHLGKIETVARGIRHEKSKLKGHLELLTRGEFIIARNRGRGVIIDALSGSVFPRMHTNAERAYIGLAVASMYDSYLYPHAKDESLWRLLVDVLTNLDMAQDFSLHDALGILQGFAHAFLARLGYADTTSLFAGNMRQYDALLAHTDISGPTFARTERGLRELTQSFEVGYT